MQISDYKLKHKKVSDKRVEKNIRFKKPPIENSSINISEATSQSSEQENSQEAQELQDIINKEINSGSIDYMKNLQDQKEILISEVGKSDPTETKRIDFLNEAHVDNFTASQAKKSENTVVKDDLSGKTVEQVQEQMRREANAPEKQYTVDEWKEIAATIILFIDTGVSSLFKWWTKDTSDDAYSLSKPKQNMLTNQLAKILMKYQARFPVEAMFVVTLIICYFPAYGIAKKRKKEIEEANAIKETNAQNAAQLKLRQAQEKELIRLEQLRIKENKKKNDNIYTPEIIDTTNQDNGSNADFSSPIEIPKSVKRSRGAPKKL